MSDAATLVAEDVVAGYGGSPVLHGVSVTALAGTITTVLGANGAGKTTLLRTIGGFVRPPKGPIPPGGGKPFPPPPQERGRARGGHPPPDPRGITPPFVLAELP